MENADVSGGLYIALALMAIQWVTPFYVAYRTYKYIDTTNNTVM